MSVECAVFESETAQPNAASRRVTRSRGTPRSHRRSRRPRTPRRPAPRGTCERRVAETLANTHTRAKNGHDHGRVSQVPSKSALSLPLSLSILDTRLCPARERGDAGKSTRRRRTCRECRWRLRGALSIRLGVVGNVAFSRGLHASPEVFLSLSLSLKNARGWALSLVGE